MSKFVLGILCILILATHRQNFLQATCTITINNDAVNYVYSNPLLSGYVASINSGIAYEVIRMATIGDAFPAYEIRVDQNKTGWIDGRLITVGRTAGNCGSRLHLQHLSIEEFPDLCEFTVKEPALAFADSSFSRIMSDLGNSEGPVIYDHHANGGYPLIADDRNAVELFIYSGHAGPFRGVLPVHLVEFTHCPPIVYPPQITATVIEDTRLWNMPYVPEGRVKADVPAGTVLHILAGPTVGPINASGSSEGQWYLLSHDQYGKGWIWSDKLQLNGQFPPAPIRRGGALPGARLWSEPNSQSGRDIGSVYNTVFLMQGPVDGEGGQWYYVETGFRSGWMRASEIGDPPPEPTLAPIPTATSIPTRTPTLPPNPIAEGETLTHARLWSEPDAQIGEFIDEIGQGIKIKVWRGPVEGAIRSDGSVSGQWYYVSAGSHKGWMWEGNFEFLAVSTPAPTIALSAQPTLTETPLPEIIGTGTALAGARLWNEPNTQTGESTGELAEGAPLNLLQGPVEGPIRADGSVMGEWYLVSSGDLVGWVWVGRIQIDQ